MRVKWEKHCKSKSGTYTLYFEGELKYHLHNDVKMIKADRMSFDAVNFCNISSWHRVNESRLTYLEN